MLYLSVLASPPPLLESSLKNKKLNSACSARNKGQMLIMHKWRACSTKKEGWWMGGWVGGGSRNR